MVQPLQYRMVIYTEIRRSLYIIGWEPIMFVAMGVKYIYLTLKTELKCI